MDLRLLLLVISCVQVSGLALINLNSEKNMKNVLSWLGQYGYYDGNTKLIDDLSYEELKTAIQEPLKEMKSLEEIDPVDGEITKDVLEIIREPRCAQKDVMHSTRTKRYTKVGRYTWKKMPVTVSFTGFLPRLTNDTQERILKECLQMWSENSGISFKYTKSPSANIRIFHGHLDGRWRKIGVAIPARPRFYSYVKFETNELWRENYKSPGYGPSYKWALCHELGHTISLGHSRDRQSMMYHRASSRREEKLNQDDINGVRRLYGPPGNSNKKKTVEGFEHLPPANVLPTPRSAILRVSAPPPSKRYQTRRPNKAVVVPPSATNSTASVTIRTTNPNVYYKIINDMIIMYYRGVPISVRHLRRQVRKSQVPRTTPSTRSRITTTPKRKIPKGRITTHRMATPMSRSTAQRNTRPPIRINRQRTRTTKSPKERKTPTTQTPTRRTNPTTRSATQRRTRPPIRINRQRTRTAKTPNTRVATQKKTPMTTDLNSRRKGTTLANTTQSSTIGAKQALMNRYLARRQSHIQ